jgi:hypothetical protein
MNHDWKSSVICFFRIVSRIRLIHEDCFCLFEGFVSHLRDLIIVFVEGFSFGGDSGVNIAIRVLDVTHTISNLIIILDLNS